MPTSQLCLYNNSLDWQPHKDSPIMIASSADLITILPFSTRRSTPSRTNRQNVHFKGFLCPPSSFLLFHHLPSTVQFLKNILTKTNSHSSLLARFRQKLGNKNLPLKLISPFITNPMSVLRIKKSIRQKLTMGKTNLSK